MKPVNSFSELQKETINLKKSYLLLYKKDAETGECAFANITSAAAKIKNVNLFVADVNVVRDIHSQYGITSAPALLELQNGKLKNIIKGCNSSAFYKAVFEESVFVTKSNNEKIQKRVTVYSTPTCSWCNTLKSYLNEHRIKYTDIDVSRDQKAAEAMVKRSGQQGVPQTDINGEMIVGFNRERINQLLGIY